MKTMTSMRMIGVLKSMSFSFLIEKGGMNPPILNACGAE